MAYVGRNVLVGIFASNHSSGENGSVGVRQAATAKLDRKLSRRYEA